MSVAAQRPRTEPTKRRHERHPDAPVPDRQVSSLGMLGAAVRQVAVAAAAADEKTLRVELLRLADEARLLARQPEPLPTPLSSRQRVAIERDRTPRAGSG